MAKAEREPAGPRHEALMKQAATARWMLEGILRITVGAGTRHAEADQPAAHQESVELTHIIFRIPLPSILAVFQYRRQWNLMKSSSIEPWLAMFSVA